MPVVVAAAIGRLPLLRLREPRHLGLGHLHAAREAGPAWLLNAQDWRLWRGLAAAWHNL